MTPLTRNDDRQILSSIPAEKMSDFLLLHLQNLWTVDGLYYLGIEDRYGTEVATEIDRNVWEVMGKIEARRLKEFFHITGCDIASLMTALRYSSWALDLEDKEVVVEQEKAVIRNLRCRVQQTRMQKGLGEFGCKPVRLGFLKAFAKEFNPDIMVTCTMCPPDNHPSTLWCEWKFTLKKKGR